uniref:Ycf80 n=1 Tax=Plocamium cartilagineum TaxID=31452 RepID=A0A1C9CHN8_PLOCA|nr:hypothetical protein Plocam_070 [Plocamium cartilagineum]AOM67906.1 hypothetical protein Plocam_070 [Plocamium cartilagineum]
MILFNLTSMFIPHILENYSHINSQHNKNTNIQINKSLVNRSSVLYLSSNKNLNSSNINSKDILVQKFIYPNFFIKLINRYWQETIFLSISNPLSDNYISRLKSDGLIYKYQSKKFLLNFSKALMTGRIDSSLNSSLLVSKVQSNSTYVKYIWRKGINLSFPLNILQDFFTYKKNNFLSKNQIILIQKLKKNQFPIFTVVNGFNQIIIAEPSEEIILNQSLINKIYKWYTDFLLKKKYSQPLYEGLFFMNPYDALEYSNFIKNKYPNSNKENHLKVFSSRLDFYYKQVRTSLPKIQFRLIPDLQELSQLIYKYRYYKNIYFHSSQKYNKDSFQGQPIYFIQPIFAINKKTKKMDLINFNYQLNEKHAMKQYEAIFINYKTAVLAWKKFCHESKDYNLPLNPKIMVYNLEDFLKTCECNSQIKQRNLLFIPTKESYKFMYKRKSETFKNKIIQIFSSKILFIKVFSKRLIWSLTSRQPISW